MIACGTNMVIQGSRFLQCASVPHGVFFPWPADFVLALHCDCHSDRRHDVVQFVIFVQVCIWE